MDKQLFINNANRIIIINKYINWFMKELRMDFEIYNNHYVLLYPDVDLITYFIKHIKKFISIQSYKFKCKYEDDYIDFLFDIIDNARLNHLDNIIQEINDEKLTEYYLGLKSNNIFMPGYDIEGKFNYFSNIRLHLPNDFIYCAANDFLEDMYLYFNGLNNDTEYYYIYDWFNKYENINNIYFTYVKNNKVNNIKIYEEELIKETWKPNRLINWCLDEEEKQDIIN